MHWCLICTANIDNKPGYPIQSIQAPQMHKSIVCEIDSSHHERKLHEHVNLQAADHLNQIKFKSNNSLYYKPEGQAIVKARLIIIE